MTKKDTEAMAVDPFGESTSCPLRRRVRVLGGVFDFSSNSRELLRLVDVAFGRLPAHSFAARPPLFGIRLLVRPDKDPVDGVEPPRMKLHAGGGLLCGTMDAANFAVVSPAMRTGLVVISPAMLRHAYHIRYELIEFVVYTLASRVQELVSLHAACLGRKGRGVLMIGASGGGKSTLSLHGMLRGLDLVAEDGLLVTPGTLRASGIGSFIHLREDALRFVDPAVDARIRRSPVIRRRSGIEKFELDLRRKDYRIAKTPVRIAGIVILSKKTGTPQRGQPHHLLRPLGGRELRRHLDSSQPYATGQPHWQSFLEASSRIGAYELMRGEHPDEGVEALLTLLR